MLVRLSTLLLLAFVTACASAPVNTADNANFFLHRWNEGKKAEPIPFYEANVTEAQYKEFVKSGSLPGVTHHGCFVAVYAPKEGRSLASERIVEPKAMHRVCL